MRAVIVGGTGAIGGATAARLAAAGWAVEVTGRDLRSMPPELTAAGVRFHSIERSDVSAIGHLVDPPQFPVRINEDTPTLPPAGDDVDPFTRDGYAPSKVAAERVALDSGLPITVIRPSKVHGRWARKPRTRSFVESMVRGDPVIELAARGASIDHLTAAANTAALIATVAALPGRRILNSADPDTPTAEQIVQAIGTRLGWNGTLDLLDGAADPTAPVADGVSDCPGYQRVRPAWILPVGNALDLLAEEIDWVATG